MRAPQSVRCGATFPPPVMSPHPPSPSPPDYAVIIIGAGPVGLLLGCLLGAQGVRVLILEKRTEPLPYSMAIGITPPSLQILAKLELAEPFINLGVKVRDCFLHGQSGYLGRVSFREIASEYRYVLALPQTETVSLLLRKIAEYPSVTIRTGGELTTAQQDQDRVEASFTIHSEADEQRVTAHYLVACDGSRSRVRDLMKVRAVGQAYERHFVMGDFVDDSGLGDEAHLFFTAEGAVESFPLPNGKRRWIVQTSEHLDEAPAGLIRELVQSRAGFSLRDQDQISQSGFTPRRLNCDRYHDGRMILCGDAAHVMSPIGGQGMNTGFADAEFLAKALLSMLRKGLAPEPLLAAYDRYRHEAAQSAIRRAGWGMWIGTWRGKTLSALRDLMLRLACKGCLSHRVGAFYAMLTIPYNTLESVPLAEFNEGTVKGASRGNGLQFLGD